MREINKDLMLPLKGAAKRYPFAVVDIESKADIATTHLHIKNEQDPEKRQRLIDLLGEDETSQEGGFERPFLVGYYDGLNFSAFRGDDCLKCMLLFLLHPSRDGMTYYAHNGGGFDWLHFLPALESLGYSFEIMTVQSKIQCLRVKPHEDSHKKGWTFLDSIQLIPASLGKITEAFDTDVKKDTEFAYDTDESDARWDEYLESDCVALYQTLMAFYELVEDRLGGEVGMTAAATAMKTFRRAYQSKPVERHSLPRCENDHVGLLDHLIGTKCPVCHEKYKEVKDKAPACKNKHAAVIYQLEGKDCVVCKEKLTSPHNFFRDAYYGGRVEIFQESVRGLQYYDINSAYPFAMLKDMPIGAMVQHRGEPTAWLREGRIGFARANVVVPLDVHIPVLPYRDDKGKLIFPVGEFSGTWTAIELDAAIAQGARVEWLESKWIQAGPIFNDMVNTLYAFRDRGKSDFNEALGYVAKIMMNSLYGKFATNPKREKIIFVRPGDDPPEGSCSANPLNDECPIFIVEEEIDAPYMAPQIAAYITALARLQLHGYMVEAHEKGVLAYCDTDSIQTTASLNHICGDGLGALKDEGAGMKFNGVFLQPKLYSLEGYREGWRVRNECAWSPRGEEYEIPKDSKGKVEATHVSINGADSEEIKPEDLKRGFVNLQKGQSLQFYHYKIVMKGYRTRTRDSFEIIQLGGCITFETLEKVGAMVRKGFKSGPKIKEITRSLRGADTKRRHINGVTYPIQLRELSDSFEDCEGEI